MIISNRKFQKPFMVFGILLNLTTIARENPVVKFSFQENKGQVCDQNYVSRPDVKFSGSVNGFNYHLKKNGVSYQLSRVDSWKDVQEIKSHGLTKEPDKTTIYRLDIDWVNSNKNSIIQAAKALVGQSNYYLQQCPDGALGVKNYEEVLYANLYTNINLKWYSKNNNLEYDFIVKPGGDPSSIKFRINGATKISVNNKGELEINTPLGIITEKAPIAYQELKQITSKWVIKNNIVGFEVGPYDKTQTLVIDPVVRVWGTYYGGTGNENIYKTKCDASGNVYSSGNTSSATTTLIATTGAHQTILSSGTSGMLVKFNSNGVRQWGTYYGGLAYALGCALDKSINQCVYICGNTGSSTGISTAGSFKPTITGGDAYLAKFNCTTGIRQWATYYGNINSDIAYSCDVDGANNVIMAGLTYSATTSTSTMIATPGSFQPNHGGNAYDAFVVKFDSLGNRLWGTFLGGNGDDCIYEVDVDHLTNNLCVVGTSSLSTGSGGIATSGALQMSNASTIAPFRTDGIVMYLNSSGIKQWGTFWGGTGMDDFKGCTFDALGNFYVVGTLDIASTVVTPPGAHQAISGGGDEAYLIKFNSTGGRIWSTYYGGSGSETGLGCAVDVNNNVYICGTTTSTNNISTSYSYQQSPNSTLTYWDGWMSKLSSSGIRDWGTYYGGTNFDDANDVEVSNTGEVYMVGRTSNTVTETVFVSSGCHQATNSGGAEALIAKFASCPNVSLAITSSTNSVCPNTPIALTFTNSGITSYTWSTGATTSTISVSPTVTTTFSVAAQTGIANCNFSTIKTLTVLPSPTIGIAVSSNSICLGTSANWIGNGASTYTWSTGATTSSITLSPTITTVYTLTGTATNGCKGQITRTLTIKPLPVVTFIATSNTMCTTSTGGTNITFTASPLGGTYSCGSPTFVPCCPNTYTCSYNYTDPTTSCSNSATQVLNIVVCTDITEQVLVNSQVLIYPNPNNGSFSLVLPQSGTYQIINSLGQQLKTMVVTEPDVSIYIDGLSEGVYYLLGRGIRKKIIVVR